jgi:hypothetical protein
MMLPISSDFRPFRFCAGVFLSIFLCVSASGQEAETSGEDKKKGGKVEDFHDEWSEKVLKVADTVDGFFGNERMDNDAQQTRVRLRLDYEVKQDRDNELSASLSARITLPQLGNRWSLIVGGDDNDDDDFDRDSNGSSDRTLAIRFEKLNTLDSNLSFDFGLRRPDDSYRVFGRIRHRKSIPLNKWVTRLDNKLYYYNSFGAEYDGKLDFDRVILPNKMFRARTRIRWWEDDEECNGGWCPEQHFYLYQRLKSRKHLLAYQFNTYFESDPLDGSDDYVERSVLKIRYRRQSRWDWLFWELSPKINFKREDDYDAKFVMLFRLESIFGYRPDYGYMDFGPERALDK